MGTSFKIVFYARSATAANNGFKAAFGRIRQIDQRLSNYKDNSELTRLGRTAPHPSTVAISEDFWVLLKAAKHWHTKTGGAFDITIGPITQLWRRARRQKKLPQPARLRAARELVDSKLVVVDAKKPKTRLLRRNMRLDPGGIAKGYACDAALAALASQSITRALINGGGDISIGDPPPGKTGWLVSIGGLTRKNKARIKVRLANCAVATSGDLYQSVVINNKRYSHIVDPRTGIGLTKRISVCVIAPNGMTADALASALSVMGRQRGMALVQKLSRIDALIVVADDNSVTTSQSPGFGNAGRTKEASNVD